MVAKPRPMALTAIICACISVGKSGCGSVWKLTAFGRLPIISSSIQSSPRVTSAPISSNFSKTDSISVGSVCVVFTRPPVMAAAAKYEPVSIRSATTAYSQPCSFSTPVTTKVSVSKPSIFAPIAINIFARSVISGSRAALRIVVTPSANAAAIKIFSVPPTVTISKTTSPPFRRPSTLACT